MTLALAAPASASDAVDAGQPAPPIVSRTLKHQPLELGELRGKVVLLQFWASWCHSCVDNLPELQALYEKHADNGLEIVGISLDEDLRAARRAIAEHGVRWPQLCDGLGTESPLARSYAVRGTPRYFLIDRQGTLAATNVLPRELEQSVEQLLSSEENR